MNGVDFKNSDTVIVTSNRQLIPIVIRKIYTNIEHKPKQLQLSNDIKQFNSNLFIVPCDSKMINVVNIRNLTNASRCRATQKKDVLRKVVCLPYKDSFAITIFLFDIC